MVVTVFFKLMGGGLLESHTHIEASLVMIAPYCAYATAEALSLSGIVAILFCGIVMAQYTRPNLSVDSQRNTQVIFKVLATLAETFVFIYMGVAMFLEPQAWTTIPFAVVGIVACMLGRALNVFPVTHQINKLRKVGRRIPKEHIWALWVVGLRGRASTQHGVCRNTGLGVQGLGVQGIGCRAEGVECRVRGVGCRRQGRGCGV